MLINLKNFLCLLLMEVCLGNSLSGTFQTCQISCSNNGEAALPITPPLGSPLVGKKGPKGSKGERGVRGHACTDCSNLSSRLDSLQAEVEDLKNENRNLTQRINRLQGLGIYRSCAAIKRSIPSADDGVYLIHPFSDTSVGISVFCDQTTDGGGWIVIQKRFDGSLDFDRNWTDYVVGFGDKSGEYWLGLENMHRLTTEGDMQLRIDLKDFDDVEKYAQYNTFNIGAGSSYTLTFGEYSGTAGDALLGHNHQGMSFTTKDRDQDGSHVNCGQEWSAGWWYRSCFWANLNGLYYSKADDRPRKPNGIQWYTWGKFENPLKVSEMKIRLK